MQKIYESFTPEEISLRIAQDVQPQDFFLCFACFARFALVSGVQVFGFGRSPSPRHPRLLVGVLGSEDAETQPGQRSAPASSDRDQEFNNKPQALGPKSEGIWASICGNSFPLVVPT